MSGTLANEVLLNAIPRPAGGEDGGPKTASTVELPGGEEVGPQQQQQQHPFRGTRADGCV